MNVKLLYLYHDAGNYKNYSEVVFRNATGLALSTVEFSLRERMIDRGWFVADQWGLPDLHFKEFDWDSELDHGWHEYEGIELSADAINRSEDIADFIKRIQSLPVEG